MNPFTAAGHIINSYVAVFTSSARAIEKTVNLVENEVDLLGEEQHIRISTARAELATLLPHIPVEQK